MKPLRIEDAARQEFIHETRYYEGTRPGLGTRFADLIEDLFERIQRQPACGRPDELGCRRLRVKGFPFSVVFREEPDEIVIYAIRPDARQPGYWRVRPPTTGNA